MIRCQNKLAGPTSVSEVTRCRYLRVELELDADTTTTSGSCGTSSSPTSSTASSTKMRRTTWNRATAPAGQGILVCIDQMVLKFYDTRDRSYSAASMFAKPPRVLVFLVSCIVVATAQCKGEVVCVCYAELIYAALYAAYRDARSIHCTHYYLAILVFHTFAVGELT